MNAPHVHAWEFDWENPPGYVCDCGACTGACDNCEEPTPLSFCSELCASEFEAKPEGGKP